MKAQVVSVLYVLVVLANLTGEFLSNELLINYSKPVLVPLLILFVHYHAEGLITLPRLLLVGALIFSWIGDILLMGNDEEIYFLGGLGSFLIAQAFYYFILMRSVFEPISWQWKSLIPILIAGALLLVTLLPYTGSMTLPIVFYAITILCMLSAARLRLDKTSDLSYDLALSGAWLFVLSDCIIALDKFYVDIPMDSFWVMLTYTSAQYLLVKGILMHPGG